MLLEDEDRSYCFRLHRDRVYYADEHLMRTAAVVSRKDLISFGTCLGKFTKGGKFFLHITALEYLAPYAKVNKQPCNFLIIIKILVKSLVESDC